jgi:TolB-like protein
MRPERGVKRANAREGVATSFEHAEILAELDRVTECPSFAASARIKKLLCFLVEETLAGREGGLKGDPIARRFFGRSDDFDAVADPIVRVEISKLRRALARCYEGQHGDLIRIELPVGTYVPRFVTGSRAYAGWSEPRSGPRPLRRTWTVGGPLVVVRPFTSPGGGAMAAALAQQIPEQIAARVARIAYVGTVPPSAADRVEHGYVVEGSVRRLSGAVRVMATMRDPGGRLVWGETRDQAVDEGSMCAVGDDLSSILFVQLFDFMTGVLNRTEALMLGAAGRAPDTVYEAMLALRQWFTLFERADYAEGRVAAESILASQPDSAPLLGLLAILHVFAGWTRCGDARSRAAAVGCARRSVAVDPLVLAPHAAMAFVHMDEGDAVRMRASAERAEATGSMPAIAGFLLTIAGEHERGVAILRQQIEVQRFVPGWYYHALFLDAYRRGDYHAALDEAQRIATPNLAWDPIDRAAALGMLGRVAEARAAARDLREVVPALADDVRGYVARLVPDAALAEALAEGLSVAGLKAR